MKVFQKNSDFSKKLKIYSLKKKKILMKNLLIKWFGAEWYCEWFHAVHSDKNDNTKWYCDECKFSRKKDNFFI